MCKMQARSAPVNTPSGDWVSARRPLALTSSATAASLDQGHDRPNQKRSLPTPSGAEARAVVGGRFRTPRRVDGRPAAARCGRDDDPVRLPQSRSTPSLALRPPIAQRGAGDERRRVLGDELPIDLDLRILGEYRGGSRRKGAPCARSRFSCWRVPSRSQSSVHRVLRWRPAHSALTRTGEARSSARSVLRPSAHLLVPSPKSARS